MKVSLLDLHGSSGHGYFALGVAVARGLTESDFAAYGAALAFVGVLITADDLGVLAGVINHPADIRRLAPTGVTVALTSGTALFVGLFFCAPWIRADPGRAVGCRGLPGHGDRCARRRRVHRAQRCDHARYRSTPPRDRHRRTSSGADRGDDAVLLTTKGPLGIAWAYAASEVAALTVTWIVSPIRPLPGFDWNIAKALLKIGLPVTAGAMFTIGTFNIDNFIIGHQLGTTRATHTSSTRSTPRVGWSTSSAGRDQPGRQSGVRRVPASEPRPGHADEPVVGLAPRGRTAVCGAPHRLGRTPLVRLLYGDRYVPAVVVVQIISALGIARLVVNLGRDGMVAEGMGRQYAAVQVLWFVLVGIFVWFGAEADGLTGAAWGHVGAAAVVTALMLSVLHRRMGVHTWFPTTAPSVPRSVRGSAVAPLGVSRKRSRRPGSPRSSSSSRAERSARSRTSSSACPSSAGGRSSARCGDAWPGGGRASALHTASRRR